MAERYTAADFANARFAEHGKEDDPAFRRPNGGKLPWKCACGGAWSDEDMADMDWAPVPTKPTITESRYRFMVEGMGFDFKAGFNDALGEFGIEVIPDPEPTNTDRLEKLIISAPGNFEGVKAILKRPANVRAWAEYLNDNNVYVKDN